MGRYTQNRIFSQNEMKKIEAAHVCVVGCGGLGGYVLELLARLGVGEITVVDGDNLQESNLNRQILSREANLGSPKVEAAKKRISSINSEIKLHALNKFLTPENAVEIISEMDLVIDALDSIETRKILAQACATENLVLVHAAIAGWYGQISTIFPGDQTLQKIYKSDLNKGIESSLGNPSFTPALLAALQVSEAVKILLGKKDVLRNKLLYIDLLTNDFEMLEF